MYCYYILNRATDGLMPHYGLCSNPAAHLTSELREENGNVSGG